MANTPRQPVTFNTAPPITGAATGAMPLMAPITAKALAKLAPLNLSVAIEREMTIPPAPAIPWIKRKAIKTSILGEKIQASVEPKNNHMDTNSGWRRPNLSLNGPNKICPTANPSMEKVSPSCTMEALVLKYDVIAGRLGKYISVTKGPKADKPPMVTRNNILFNLSIKTFTLSILSQNTQGILRGIFPGKKSAFFPALRGKLRKLACRPPSKCAWLSARHKNAPQPARLVFSG